ncbi:hypothetical protein BYT27DRAFT_6693416 [Phlegmacium glaucopus]|nr:hypothetical protein BYT27DRAFT_6693416 [Phlegmacium glaucopus]
MVGMVQFMTRKILSPQGTQRVMHQPTHDVEVLSFCVMRNVQLRAINKSAPADVHAQCKAFRTIFRQAFRQATPDDIERQSGSRVLTFPTDPKVDRIVTNFMSSPLYELFFDLQILVHAAQAPVDPANLTHDAFLAVVDRTIALLLHPFDGLHIHKPQFLTS